MHPLLLFLALATSSSAQPATPTPAPVEIVNLEQHLWTTMAEGDFATVRSLFGSQWKNPETSNTVKASQERGLDVPGHGPSQSLFANRRRCNVSPGL